MITEPALNSLPDSPTKIFSTDLPIRIEAAIQVDYNYSDFYQITWIPGVDEDTVFFYLFDGCSQTECPKNGITMVINDKTTSKILKMEPSNCFLGSFTPHTGDDILNIQLSSPKPTRYGLVIASGTSTPSYNIACTPHFRDYDYFSPPLPSTGLVDDPYSRSTCFEAPASLNGEVLIGDVVSFLGPYTVPAAINFKLSGWQTLRIYISASGIYDVRIRQAESHDSPCETDRCSIPILFDLFWDQKNQIQFLSHSLTSSKADEPCDRATWYFNLTQGYYLFSIFRNPAVPWIENEAHVDSFFIAPSGTSPFSGTNCTALTYYAPCRRYFPASTTEYIHGEETRNPPPYIQAENPTVFLVVTFVMVCILIVLGALTFALTTGCQIPDDSGFVVVLDFFCSPFDKCCRGYEQADLVPKEGQVSSKPGEDPHVELEDGSSSVSSSEDLSENGSIN